MKIPDNSQRYQKQLEDSFRKEAGQKLKVAGDSRILGGHCM